MKAYQFFVKNIPLKYMFFFKNLRIIWHHMASYEMHECIMTPYNYQLALSVYLYIYMNPLYMSWWMRKINSYCKLKQTYIFIIETRTNTYLFKTPNPLIFFNLSMYSLKDTSPSASLYSAFYAEFRHGNGAFW